MNGQRSSGLRVHRNHNMTHNTEALQTAASGVASTSVPPNDGPCRIATPMPQNVVLSGQTDAPSPPGLVLMMTHPEIGHDLPSVERHMALVESGEWCSCQFYHRGGGGH